MTVVRITYFGMEGAGRNVTEAKRDAGAKIEAALSGSYSPLVVSWRGCAALVYREPDGWRKRLIALGTEDGVRGGRVYGDGPYDGADEAEKAARSHVAQCGYRLEDGLTVPDVIEDKADRREFERWAEFQQRAAAAKRLGMTDDEAHSAACRNPARADLVARLDAALATA